MIIQHIITSGRNYSQVIMKSPAFQFHYGHLLKHSNPNINLES
jgi:hypothetical protein